MIKALLAAAVLAVFAPAALEAEDPAVPPAGEPARFESEKSGVFGGERIRYRVIAGETYLKNDVDEPTAAIWSMTYLREGVRDAVNRPVLFIFNGGPGSSSVWLHMGVYGPKRVVLPSDAEDDGAAPYRLEDNPLSMLDVADMVFIDPVGTGYSRAIGKGKNEDFWGVREDADSIAEFIRLWLGEHGRWMSPKYLSGESYGTTRSAQLLQSLSGGWTDIAVNGVILISSILDFQTARYAPGNDYPYISYFPTMAATAWYHGKVDQNEYDSFEAFMDEVRAFTLGHYATALLMGNRLTEEAFDSMAEQVAHYSGLKVQYVKNANLRINNIRFMKELLRDEGYTVGRLDSRFKGQDYEGTGERFDGDPSGYGIDASYTASMNAYLRGDLGVTLERPYEILSRKPGGSWKGIPTRAYSGSVVNVAPHIGRAMRENNDFRVLLASGYYDLATPFFASENSMNANGIDTDRVTFTYYESGHMMYVHQPSIEALAKDIRDWLAAAN